MTIKDEATGIAEAARERQENQSPQMKFVINAIAAVLEAAIAVAALTGKQTWKSRFLAAWAAAAFGTGVHHTFMSYLEMKAGGPSVEELAAKLAASGSMQDLLNQIGNANA